MNENLLQPTPFLALDIETGNAGIEDVEKTFELFKPPANIKDPEKIQARMEEKKEKMLDKAALLDASPIICIACRTDTGGVIFSSMNAEGLQIPQWELVIKEDEKTMLEAFREWADEVVMPETIIAGHNCVNFDLPKIRNGFIRHRLQLPMFLLPALRGEISVEVVDTMKLAKAFTMQYRDDFAISLDKLADILSLPRPKQAMSGADVPKAHERGEYAPILVYCCIDTETTAEAAKLMLGISNALY